jgi:hypothetical protein
MYICICEYVYINKICIHIELGFLSNRILLSVFTDLMFRLTEPPCPEPYIRPSMGLRPGPMGGLGVSFGRCSAWRWAGYVIVAIGRCGVYVGSFFQRVYLKNSGLSRCRNSKFHPDERMGIKATLSQTPKSNPTPYLTP